MATGLGDEIGWWCPSLDDSGDGTLVLYDLSGNGNDGTMYLMTTGDWVDDTDEGGVRALTHDGLNDRVRMGSVSELALMGDASWGMWIKPTNVADSAAYPLAYGITGETEATNCLYCIRLEYAVIAYIHEYGEGDNELHSFTATVTAGEWIHILMTRNASTKTVSLYVNGVWQENIVYTNAPTGGTTSELDIGKFHGTGVTFYGSTDDTRIYDRVLTQAEITHLASRRGAQDFPSLVGLGDEIGWWCPTLDDRGNGTDYLTDLSENGNDGALTSMDPATDWAADVNSGGVRALEGDGTVQYSLIGDQPEFSFGDASDDSPFSISIWAKFDTLGAGLNGIFSKSKNITTGLSEWLLVLGDSGEPVFILYDNSSSHSIRQTSDSNLSTGTWYQITCTYDGSGSHTGITIYIDGVELTSTGSENGTYVAMHSGTSDVAIGSSFYDNITYDRNIDGLWDDARIFDRVLTSAEITHLAIRRGIQGASMPVGIGDELGWWCPSRYNYPSTTQLIDLAGHNDGALKRIDIDDWAADTNEKGIASLSLANVGKDIKIPNDSSFHLTGAMSISLWIKGISTTTGTTGMGQLGTTGDRGWILGTQSDGDTYFYITEDGTALSSCVDSASHSSTVWTHYIGIYSPSNYLKLFRNGTEVASKTSSVPAAQFMEYNDISFSYRGGTSARWNGVIDDHRMFDRILTANEIAYLASGRGVLGPSQIITPTTVALATTEYAPSIITPQTATPTTVVLTLTEHTPLILIPQTITPTTVALALSEYAPSVVTPQTVAPTTVALALAEYAPSVVTPQTITPTTTALTLSEYAPSVVTPQTVTPTTVALETTTSTPEVNATDNLEVTPSVVALTLTAYAPTVTTPQTVIPTTTALALDTYALTVVTPQTVTPTTVAFALTNYAPTVATPQVATPTTVALAIASYTADIGLTNHIEVTPTTVALAIASYAPDIGLTDNLEVTPTTVALTLAGYAPDISLTDVIEVTPTTVALALTGYTADISLTDVIEVTPAIVELTLAGYAPGIIPSNNIELTPSISALTLASYAPSVTTPQTVIPTATTLALTGYALSTVTPQTVAPTTKALTLTNYAPSVTVGNAIEVSPVTATLALVGYASTITIPQTITPITETLTLTGYAPSVSISDAIELVPETVLLTLVGYAPSISTTTTTALTPNTVTLTLTGYAPTVSTPILLSPATLALVLAPYAPVVAYPVTLSPVAASLTLSTFTASVSTGEHVSGSIYYNLILMN